MRIVTLLFASLMLLFSAAASAQVDIEPGEYVVFYHHDVLGSPVTATNEQGQVIWHERTESYGKSEGRVSQNGNPFGDNALPAGNSRQGYTGHTLDNSAGLTYMKARYYDHNIGRFLSNDPVGFSQDNPMMFNRYAYANNNPYKYYDPEGKTPDMLYVTDPIAYNQMIGDFIGAGPFTKQGSQEIADYNKSIALKQIDALTMFGGFGVAAAKTSAVELTKSQLTSIQSYLKQIKKHQKKLDEFKANPTVRPGMEKLSPDLIKKQQQIRIQKLENEIQGFKNNIEKIKNGELDR